MKKNIPSKKHRVCKFPKCKHILSIYNPEIYCYIHQKVMTAERIQTSKVLL